MSLRIEPVEEQRAMATVDSSPKRFTSSKSDASSSSTRDLKRLVHHFIGAASDDAIQSTLQYSTRLLSTYMRSSFTQNELQLKSLILRRVDAQQGTRTAAKLLDLLDCFLKQKSISKRSATLYFLLLLEGSSTRKQPIFLEQLPEQIPLRKHERSIVKALQGTEHKIEHNNDAIEQQSAVHTETIRQFHQQRYEGEQLSEYQLVKDMLLVSQGLNGSYLKYNGHEQTFVVGPDYKVSQSQAHLVRELANSGLFFEQLKTFVDERSRDASYGLIGKAFCSVLREELTEYYRFITLLEAQLHMRTCMCESVLLFIQLFFWVEKIQPQPDRSASMTLRRLLVWMQTPLQRLKALTEILYICAGVRGGQLLSEVFRFTLSGNTRMQKLAREIMDRLMSPFLEMLNAWVYRGVLIDSTGEFFISSDPHIVADSQYQDAYAYWSRKYGISKDMLPIFIGDDLASKVLLCGKSINFARVFCGVSENFMHRMEAKQSLLKIKWCAEAFRHCQLPGGDVVTDAYKLSSSMLLRILQEKHKLYIHLRAMRRYLLLGQGDLFMFLMEDMRSELDHPAEQLLRHNVTGILDGALRTSNARYDDSEVLARIDVTLLEHLPHEKGWDIFSLSYATDGPISAVLPFHHMRSYQQEIQPVLRNLHLLGSEMGHFVKQIQHYLLFEVLETQWKQFIEDAEKAPDLNAIIGAHDKFIGSIQTQMFLTPNAQEKLSQLRSIFDQVIEFQNHHRELHSLGMDEYDRRSRGAYRIQTRATMGAWGTSNEDDSEETSALNQFKEAVRAVNAKVSVVTSTYKDMVKRFLNMLQQDHDHNMRYLSNRIDFNGHYDNAKIRYRIALQESADAATFGTSSR
eukprot:gene10880-2955_t